MREFALEVYFSRWHDSARYHMSASDSESLSLHELLALADDEDRMRWQNLSFGYTHPRGSRFLREIIARDYSTATAQSVLCFSGAQEAIHAVMHAFLQPEDHAIVVTPNYQAMETIPLKICAVTGIGLDPCREWTLDIDAVEHAVRPNTKLIAINFPNNPTGKLLDRDAFEALTALCRRHGIWLFSDEVYRLIEREPGLCLPPAVDVYERGVSLAALSKSYGLPGLRLGWVVCRDAAMLQRIEQVKHYLSICNPAPCEVLAGIALSAKERILRRNRSIAAANCALIEAFFIEQADLFDWHLPDGGVMGFPRYKGPEGVEAFCQRLIEEDGILLLPSSIFLSDLLPTPRDRFRIGFGRRDFAAGLEAMGDSLRRRRGSTRNRRAPLSDISSAAD